MVDSGSSCIQYIRVPYPRTARASLDRGYAVGEATIQGLNSDGTGTIFRSLSLPPSRLLAFSPSRPFVHSQSLSHTAVFYVMLATYTTTQLATRLIDEMHAAAAGAC